MTLADRDRQPYSGEPLEGDSPFAEVVDAHWTAVYRLLGVMTRNVHDTEELTQETFLRALRQFASLRPESNLRAWLMRIAANAWSDLKRKRPRVGFETLEHEPPEDARSTEAELKQAEQMRLAQAAVEQLPETPRTVFHLRVVEELSYREIAELLDTTEEAARWQMHDARKKLLRHMTRQN
jgi:RNA polymerase sigma-70 factor (ECF subfamily)